MYVYIFVCIYLFRLLAQLLPKPGLESYPKAGKPHHVGKTSTTEKEMLSSVTEEWRNWSFSL